MFLERNGVFKNIAHGVLIAHLLIFSCHISAGPIRDWLRERKSSESPDQSFESNYPYGKIVLPADVRLLSNIAYGNAERQRLDVYLPKKTVVNAPVIFMVHGGAWRIGDKTAPRVIQNKLNYWLPKGFILVSTNYRLIPDANPAEQVQDIARALAFAQSEARKWGADPEKFILMGHSAGAHLVLMLATKPSVAFTFGAKSWLGTIALDNAAFDVVQIMQRKHYDFYDDAFGNDPDFWRSMSPLYALQDSEKKSVSPIMAICSTQRPDKPCRQAHEFAMQAEKTNARVEVLEQNKSHGDINADLGLPGDYTNAVEKFIRTLDDSFKDQM